MAKKKKKSIKIVIWSVIGVVVVAVALSAMLHPKRINYTEVKAKVGNITTYYSFSGNIAAKNSQIVYSDSAMQIDKIEVSEGQLVKKDDVLMKTTNGESIKAPIDGTVSEIDVDVDAQEMGGATLCKIVDYKNLEVDVQVDEYDLPSITVNKKATVTINALDKDVSGKVTEVSREGISTNGVTYFNAKVSLPNEDDLRVGMSTESKVLNKSAKSVITLPMSSIQFDNDNNPYVIMNDKKDKVKKVDLTLGINDGTTVEVKSGLSSGDTVLVPPTAASTTTGFGSMSSRKSSTSSTATSTGGSGSGGAS